MIDNKKIVITNGTIETKKIFNINNGLQQGMLNSPMLFNIFISDLILNINNPNDTKILAYADDILIYNAEKKKMIFNETYK